MQRILAMGIILLFLILAAGCGQGGKLPEIDFNQLEEKVPHPPQRDKPLLRVAVASMTTAKENIVFYEDLIAYLGKKLDMNTEIIQRSNYSQLNDLIYNGEVDVAFICSYAYVLGKKQSGLEILAVPVIGGKTTYRSDIIVRRDSPIKSWADLKGKTFAFADPLSFSGFIYPSYKLARSGEKATGFFQKTIFTYSHDASIKAVAEGIVDAAAVDNLIFDYMAKKDPSLKEKLRVINQSPETGIPPVVVPSRLDGGLKNRLREILLNLHKDPEGRKILQHLNIESYVPGRDEEYNLIREMAKMVIKT